MLKIIDGNIFNTDSQVLVNTVNCDGYMGKGIALEFKLRYAEMYNEYKKLCDKKWLQPGKLYYYNQEHPRVLCFPTKNSYKLPSKIEYLKAGLNQFVSTYKKYNIKSITFPLLGASCGKLHPDISLSIMQEYLQKPNDIEITIVKNYIKQRDEQLVSFLDYVRNGGELDNVRAFSHNRLVSIINSNYHYIYSLSDILNIKEDVMVNNEQSYTKYGITQQTLMNAFSSYKQMSFQTTVYDFISSK